MWAGDEGRAIKSSGHSSGTYFSEVSLSAEHRCISEQNRQESLPLGSFRSRDRDFSEPFHTSQFAHVKSQSVYSALKVPEGFAAHYPPPPPPPALPFWSHCRPFSPYLTGLHAVPRTCQAHPFLVCRAFSLAASSAWSVPLDKSFQLPSSCPSCLNITFPVRPALTDLFKYNLPPFQQSWPPFPCSIFHSICQFLTYNLLIYRI